MVKRLLITVSFLTPLASHADCSVFDASTQTLHIHTRADKDDKTVCNTSPRAAGTGSQDESLQNSRNPRSNTEKLRSFTDLKRQAEYLSNSPRYYGQR
ncbi:hypothetical protein EDC30_101261 [Paucimonas lemoignei]|uniref:Lipoprotein n=1 Tax=Paucimonas lemoignei TaxID=29443 RepID=A0A4R3I3N2_PAULE|nr:hypothetical protein [Paucimonas lemoignei]TCS39305.1 hypothetical protein EDC30_101261 [Paucimonas lemoignei]